MKKYRNSSMRLIKREINGGEYDASGFNIIENQHTSMISQRISIGRAIYQAGLEI